MLLKTHRIYQPQNIIPRGRRLTRKARDTEGDGRAAKNHRPNLREEYAYSRIAQTPILVNHAFAWVTLAVFVIFVALEGLRSKPKAIVFVGRMQPRNSQFSHLCVAKKLVLGVPFLPGRRGSWGQQI